MSEFLLNENQFEETPAKLDSQFSTLLDEYEFPEPQRGEIISGEILRIESDAVFIDVGSKRDAIVPYQEVQKLDESFLDTLSTGDEVPVYVTQTPRGDNNLIVSLERGLQELDWKRAQEIENEDACIELKVVKYNKGGLLVEFGRILGFVPNSHLPFLRNVRDTQEQNQLKADQIGKTLPVKLIQLERQNQKLVFSAAQGMIEKRLDELILGEVLEGKVVSIKPYGAFVDIGDGLVALLHISNISWDHIDHPTDCVSRGEVVEVKVETIDKDKQQVSLNRKALLPKPE